MITDKGVRDGSDDDEISACGQENSDELMAECSECSKQAPGTDGRRPYCVSCCFARPLLFGEIVKAALLNGNACEGLRSAERCGICPSCLQVAAGPAAARSRPLHRTSSRKRRSSETSFPSETVPSEVDEAPARPRSLLTRPLSSGSSLLKEKSSASDVAPEADYNDDNTTNKAGLGGYSDDYEDRWDHRRGIRLRRHRPSRIADIVSSSSSRAMQQGLRLLPPRGPSDPTGMAAPPARPIISSLRVTRPHAARHRRDYLQIIMPTDGISESSNTAPDYSSSLLLAPHYNASLSRAQEGLPPRRSDDPRQGTTTTTAPLPPASMRVMRPFVVSSPPHHAIHARHRRDDLPEAWEAPNYSSALLLAPHGGRYLESYNVAALAAAGSRPPAGESGSSLSSSGVLMAASIRRSAAESDGNNVGDDEAARQKQKHDSQATTDRVNRFLARR